MSTVVPSVIRQPSVDTAPRLSRAAGHGRPAAPVRAVHLGLGNFFRAHQAWYTDRAPDADRWGIAAFTGMGSALAEALAPQGGLYTLVTRAPDGDRTDVVSSLSAVHGADHDAWLHRWADRGVGLITFTVTEAGYVRGPDGRLDHANPAVAADVAALRADPRAPVRTAPARVVAGLLARRGAGAGPIALLPCDNLPDNGAALAAVVADLADAVDPTLAGWVADQVAIGTTMVDRITPATTDAERAAVLAATGLVDAAPVPTEPFAEWVIAGRFPAGRPAWDQAGAAVVDDVVPFEQRKLWLLNGSHSLLAYAGSVLGHRTVDQAIADPRLAAWVQTWWDEAARHLTLPEDHLRSYRAALLERFANPRIAHRLAQIAADGSQKLPVRILPALRAERAAGRVPVGAATVLAGWILTLRGQGAPVLDTAADTVVPLAGGTLPGAVRAVLGYLAPDLAADEPLVAAVLGQARTLTDLH